MYVVVSLNNWAFFLCSGAAKDNIIFLLLLCRGLCRGKNIVALRK